MNDPIVVTRNLVKRGWTDFEPKVITGLLTGSVAAFLTGTLAQYGIMLDPMQQKMLIVGCYFLGSYATPSSGTTITRTVTDAASKVVKEIETHSGNSVTTVTASTPIQKPKPTPPPVTEPEPDVAPEVPDIADQPTAIIRPTGQAFLDRLPSSNDIFMNNGGH